MGGIKLGVASPIPLEAPVTRTSFAAIETSPPAASGPSAEPSPIATVMIASGVPGGDGTVAQRLQAKWNRRSRQAKKLATDLRRDNLSPSHRFGGRPHMQSLSRVSSIAVLAVGLFVVQRAGAGRGMHKVCRHRRRVGQGRRGERRPDGAGGSGRRLQGEEQGRHQRQRDARKAAALLALLGVVRSLREARRRHVQVLHRVLARRGLARGV